MKLSLILLSVLFSANAMAQYVYGEANYTPQCAVREDRTNICLGDHVIAYDTNPNDGYSTPFENRAGVVLEIYSNNVALVKLDDGTGTYTVDLGSLAREVPSLYGYDRGDRVQLEWNNGRHGTVYHVYENGEVQVKWDRNRLGITYVSIDDLDISNSYPVYGYPTYGIRPYGYGIVAWNFGPMPAYGYAYRPWWSPYNDVYFNYGWHSGMYYGYFPGYYYPYSGVWFVIHPGQPYHCGVHSGWNYGSYPYGTKGYRDYGVYNRRGSWNSYGSGYDLNGSRRAARGYTAQTWNTQTRGGTRIYEANVNRGDRGTINNRSTNNGNYVPNTNNSGTRSNNTRSNNTNTNVPNNNTRTNNSNNRSVTPPATNNSGSRGNNGGGTRGGNSRGPHG